MKKAQVHQFMIWSTAPFVRNKTIDLKLVHQLMEILEPIFGFDERTLNPEILNFIRSKYGDLSWNVLTIYIFSNLVVVRFHSRFHCGSSKWWRQSYRPGSRACWEVLEKMSTISWKTTKTKIIGVNLHYFIFISLIHLFLFNLSLSIQVISNFWCAILCYRMFTAVTSVMC